MCCATGPSEAEAARSKAISLRSSSSTALFFIASAAAVAAACLRRSAFKAASSRRSASISVCPFGWEAVGATAGVDALIGATLFTETKLRKLAALLLLLLPLLLGNLPRVLLVSLGVVRAALVYLSFSFLKPF